MDQLANGKNPLKFLNYGRTGWIGGLLGKICESQGIDFTYSSDRLENRTSLENDIATIKPTHVFNAAGITDRPNVESHKVETIRTNVVASAL
ncbi:unnamed protein product [Linum tenue]|uniref:RmlD-like substrate binding domain-containing protein n=1 Tax=Linum tenue TaxID=586396 RepID=A0AAV0KMK3_9ROSI|nr:unnamed protein product [Linum tenue]